MLRLRTLWPAALAGLMTLALAVAQDAPAQQAFGRGPGQGLWRLGDHAVELTDTGAVITITSADPAVAQRLIALHTDATRPMRGLPAGVTRTVEALDNGVRITLVGATPDDIAWIQQRHETVPAGPPADVQRPLNGQGQGPGFGRGQGRGQGFGQGRGQGFGRQPGQGVGLGLQAGPAAGFTVPRHEVTNLANGIKVTITSDDADQVALLQQRAATGPAVNCPFAAQVTRTTETLVNGIAVTMTSEDPDTVAWLQANPPIGPRGMGNGQGPGRGQGWGRGNGYGGSCPWR